MPAIEALGKVAMVEARMGTHTRFALALVICVAVAGAVRPASSARRTYRLTVVYDLSGAGTGVITSTPPGLCRERVKLDQPCDCTTGNCRGTFDEGTKVTLVAKADPLSHFAGWRGACLSPQNNTCIVTMSADRAISVRFDRIPSP